MIVKATVGVVEAPRSSTSLVQLDQIGPRPTSVRASSIATCPGVNFGLYNAQGVNLDYITRVIALHSASMARKVLRNKS